MAVNSKWYPLPEVSPAEGNWWEKERSKPFSGRKNISLPGLVDNPPLLITFYYSLVGARRASPNLSSSVTRSFGQSTPNALSENGERCADLSISSLHTATPFSQLGQSSHHTPRKASNLKFCSETTQSRYPPITIGGAGHNGKKDDKETAKQLDELWTKFQSSSMLGKENRGVTGCTCSCLTAKPVNKRMLRKEGGLTTEAALTKNLLHVPRKRSVLIERAVQTSPAPNPVMTRTSQICHVTHSPSIMFTVASPCQTARPQLKELTLSEAFALSHPEFIEASLKRQREIRQRKNANRYGHHYDVMTRRPHPSTAYHRHTSELILIYIIIL